MKHVRTLGLCLLAAFALSAIVASAAQAAGPEWGHCVKLSKDKGKYKDANCTELEGKTSKGKFKPSAKGAYEWVAGADTTCYEEPGKKGKYKNSACTELEGKTKKGVFTPEEKGKYEKVAGGPKFTAKSTGGGVLYSSVYYCNNAHEEEVRAPRADCAYSYGAEDPESKVECEHETATGEAAGSDEIKDVSVLFTGCSFGGVPAETHGLAPGEIKVNELKGRLGYIKKSATPEPEVGVVLEPAVSGGTFASFEIPSVAEAEITVGEGNATEGAFYEESLPGKPDGNDGVISPIGPINKMTHEFTQDYRVLQSKDSVRDTYLEHTNEYCGQELCGNKYENVPSHLENGSNELLESFLQFREFGSTSTWSPAAQELTNVNTLEGEAEIKA